MPRELPEHEVYAIRFARHERTARHNFISASDGHDGAMPMDYFVWLIRGPGRDILVDTGFGRAAAEARGRLLLRCPTEGLARLGVDSTAIQDVIITHLHYDHAGNVHKFPNASFHLQEREMQFATGKYMCHGFLRLAYAASDIMAMVERLYQNRVKFVDGDVDFAPGISLHWVGGHTAGLQVVRVHTAAGWLVLASDAFHYYANRDQASPFPIVFNAGDMLEGFGRLSGLVTDERLIVPGHDPEVMRRFRPDDRDAEMTVRLHQPA